ncbi:hypothetical protein DPMN_184559 [Dreissena polymorpha]|uniref:Laminin G domain-containing protein n=1 Tax=Dreissena polymorpha TaxID=45954 RepID=A0A9D4DJD9_DREPO|nr:hypothetical protein DPMN_184559 [Dreissena polymorpha]
MIALTSFVVVPERLNATCKQINVFSDKGPVNLIDEAFPRIGQLPEGVSVVYDVKSHVHALQFLPNTKDIQIPTRKIFQQCQYFPEEFSVFFIMKHVQMTKHKQCLLSIAHAQKTQLSVCISRKKIVFTFDNKRTRFRSSVLTFNQWHTVGFSVTGSHVTMTTDCLNIRKHKLKRAFPSFLEVENSVINIGGCNSCESAFQVRR